MTPWRPKGFSAATAFWLTGFFVATTSSLVASHTIVVNGTTVDASLFPIGELNCTSQGHVFDKRMHKEVYNVYVHSIRGFDTAMELFNGVFSEYLTATAGKRFDPPIQFSLTPVDYEGLFEALEDDKVDFFTANPGTYTCVGVEYGAQPLVTFISRLEVRGHIYDLDVFGGVMFVRADNDEINEIADFEDKIIASGAISQLMAGPLQFYEMEKAGVSYVMGPKQVVTVQNQFDVVHGVLEGKFDVGFVRTDQIERTKDIYGINPDSFKIIAPKIYVLDDGNLFPFLHSTPIYPEWALSSLKHVDKDVAEEVQEALLGLQAHAEAYERLLAGETWVQTRCDTTPEIAKIAYEARISGKVAGYRPGRSYFNVRSMQEAAGFMFRDEGGNFRCSHTDKLYETITCPPDHYKLPEDEYNHKCAEMGLECKEGYFCYCKPCVKAFEVDVFDWTEDKKLMPNQTKHQGCPKMSVCGTVMQTKTIVFRAVDNVKRSDATLEVKMHLASSTEFLPVTRIGDYEYQVTWSENSVGIGIMEIFINGIQIPQSPIRVRVEPRNCELDFPGQRRSSDDDGRCQCKDGTMDIRGRCIESTIIAIVISVTAACLVAVMGVCYLRYRNHKIDQMWIVSIDELQFDDPVEIIGQGSFGVVLLAQYRGTKVALKRALKVGRRGSKRGSKHKTSSGSKTSNANNADSVGLSSGGMSSCGQGSEDDCGSNQEHDPELGERPPGDNSSQGSTRSGESAGNGHTKSASYDPNSLGFLAADFGPASKWGWLFPWMQKRDYHYQFKESILGGGGSSAATKSWHAIICPWFNADVQREEEFMQEMRVFSRLRHPCVTTVLGAVVSRNHEPMLVMEYMEYGSLHALLRNETMHLSGEFILQVVRDVAQGLRFLHSSKPAILHGDLKGRNILIDSRFRAKLCDFGLSTKKGSHITGTPFWLAPEYLRGQTDYTTHCDMYSFGIIFFEIYSRSEPYKGEDFRDTIRKICDRRINKRPTVPECCPPKMVDVMKKLWSPDPFFRPQAKDMDTLLLDLNMRDAEPIDPEERDQNARKERRTGDMLYELFPKHVADQLKAGTKVEPENHEEVTIVYSDIVHFTDISKALTPLKVSNMLDRLYLAFDKVARANNVFKVETIGDAYMGVTNLEKNQMDTHVKDAAYFAMDLVKEANKILIDEDHPEKGCINIRVGFHSGNVVSSVIGSLNPRYSLFGDALHVASQMEQNSKANRVLTSEVTSKLLREQAPEIDLVKRGKISVKSKGEMTVYWVGGSLVTKNDILTAAGVEKRVGFNENEEAFEGVDEHLWRKDLQGQLQELDTDRTKTTPKGLAESQAKSFEENRGVSHNTKASSAPEQAPKKRVKEAAHFMRGKHS